MLLISSQACLRFVCVCVWVCERVHKLRLCEKSFSSCLFVCVCVLTSGLNVYNILGNIWGGCQWCLHTKQTTDEHTSTHTHTHTHTHRHVLRHRNCPCGTCCWLIALSATCWWQQPQPLTTTTTKTGNKNHLNRKLHLTFAFTHKHKHTHTSCRCICQLSNWPA